MFRIGNDDRAKNGGLLLLSWCVRFQKEDGRTSVFNLLIFFSFLYFSSHFPFWGSKDVLIFQERANLQ